jgi:tyrosyl-tRNA synthetase
MTADDLRVLEAGTASIDPAGGLAEKLALGRPLRVKLGLDPTAPAVTLGWAVVLRKLRQFQDLGHTAVLIVGDFTARVGDPSGKSETRPRLAKEEVDAYAEAVLAQFAKVLDMDRVELRHNSEWLETLDIEGVLRLAAATTVARMLERDDFAARYADGRPISLMEFMYPLLQGFDSVSVEADVELGGSDQLFNLLVGRDLQRDRGQDPQVAVTMPLLEGTDGVQKMSQSLGNYVAVDDPPDEMFGKLMRIPDGLIARYLRLATGVPTEEIDAIERGLADGSLHPNDQKRRMAREIVDLYHGPNSGNAAEERFDHVHREREIPDDVPEVRLADLGISSSEGVWIAKVIVGCGFASSNAEARRLLAQGGVRLDGEQVTGEEQLTAESLDGTVLQVGRRRFVRLRA